MTKAEAEKAIEQMGAFERLELGQALGRLRDFAGLSQRDMYEDARLTLPRSTYANMERTGGGQAAHFVAAMEVLNTDLDKLLTWYRAARDGAAAAIGKAV